MPDTSKYGSLETRLVLRQIEFPKKGKITAEQEPILALRFAEGRDKSQTTNVQSQPINGSQPTEAFPADAAHPCKSIVAIGVYVGPSRSRKLE